MAERWKELQRAARCVRVLAPALAALACSGDAAEPRVDEPSEEGVAWLREAVIPLEALEPAASAADLEPVRALIGDARVVVLGEANHGARELFLLKHRLVRFLAEEMGFDHFLIEATWPESNHVACRARESPQSTGLETSTSGYGSESGTDPAPDGPGPARLRDPTR